MLQLLSLTPCATLCTYASSGCIYQEQTVKTMSLNQYNDIRNAVTKLCDQFPAEYWRLLDREMKYPSEFVAALTDAGWLAALIPEAYGGAGLPLSAGAAILEEIHRSGGNASACHAQMYTMGTLLRHGSDQQKQTYLPGIADGTLRLQAFGVTESVVRKSGPVVPNTRI